MEYQLYHSIGVSDIFECTAIEEIYELSSRLYLLLRELHGKDTLFIVLVKVIKDSFSLIICHDVYEGSPVNVYYQEQETYLKDIAQTEISHKFYLGLADTNTYVLYLPQEY